MSAAFYQPFYLLIVTIATAIIFHYYYENNGIKEKGPNMTISLLLVVFLTFFIGLRPNNIVFVDTISYVRGYYNNEGFQFNWDSDTQNLFFDNFFYWVASKRLGYSFFFTVIAAIYFGGILFACKLMFPRNVSDALIVYLGAFSTFSYATNGIKAGSAASVFLIAMGAAMNIKDNRKIVFAFLIALTSYYFHHSMMLCVGAFILAFFYKNTKAYLIFWVVALLVSALHITFFQNLFGNLIVDDDAHGAEYLLNEGATHGKTGFRLDFIIYSLTPIVMGLYAIYRKNIKNVNYVFLLNVYIISNGIWLLCMYANYNNRIAYLSWLLLPFVLVYPVLHPSWGKNRYLTFSFVMAAHLAFTLFMMFVYYA